MSKLIELYKKHKEIVNYLIFGGLTTLISILSYSALDLIFRTAIENDELRVAVCKCGSWVLAVIFAFITNKLFVFESKSWKGKTVAKEVGAFFASRIATGIFEIVFTPLLVGWGLDQTILGITGAWATLIVIIIVMILNYVLSKFLVFTKKKKTEPANATETSETVKNLLGEESTDSKH